MAKQCMKPHALIMIGINKMTTTSQLEMKLHEQAEKISKLNHELDELKEKLDWNQAILENLCERLHAQG